MIFSIQLNSFGTAIIRVVEILKDDVANVVSNNESGTIACSRIFNRRISIIFSSGWSFKKNQNQFHEFFLHLIHFFILGQRSSWSF